MNQIFISGNIGSDVQTKEVKGYKITSFSLAHTPRKKSGNEWVDGETIWFRVVIWGEKGEAVAGAYAKGSSVTVTGSFNVSSYTAKDGTQKSANEIIASEVLANPMKVKRPAEAGFGSQGSSSYTRDEW